MNLNQLSIIGFIGQKAETKSLPNGTLVTKFSVATKRSWKGENGTWQQKTQWHNIVARERRARVCAGRTDDARI